MPLLTGEEEALYETDDGLSYLANGLVVRKRDDATVVIGRWDPPEMFADADDEEKVKADEVDWEQRRAALEQQAEDEYAAVLTSVRDRIVKRLRAEVKDEP